LITLIFTIYIINQSQITLSVFSKVGIVNILIGNYLSFTIY